MKDIIVVGAGGLGREVCFLIEEINSISQNWNLLGFSERSDDRIGERVGRYKIICTDQDLPRMNVAIAVAIGNPAILSQVLMKLSNYSNLTFPNLIHPSVIWDEQSLTLGSGNIMSIGNILTTDIKIGSNNILNPSSTIGHDVVIGDGCVLNWGCHISGNVKIGDYSLIGTGAVILEGLNIGNHAIIGAGAVVTKNVPNRTTVVGVPARPMD